MNRTAQKAKSPGQDAQELLREQAMEVSKILSLLANENRLLILCYLMAHGEMRVGEIVDAVKLSQSALSQHLTKLRDDGLVVFRREAQTLHYRIADPRIVKLIKTLKKLYCEEIEL